MATGPQKPTKEGNKFITTAPTSREWKKIAAMLRYPWAGSANTRRKYAEKVQYYAENAGLLTTRGTGSHNPG